MTAQQEQQGVNLKAEGKPVLQGSSGGRAERKANLVETASKTDDGLIPGLCSNRNVKGASMTMKRAQVIGMAMIVNTALFALASIAADTNSVKVFILARMENADRGMEVDRG